MLEMTTDVMPNAGKHITAKTACAIARETQMIQCFDWPK